MINSTNNNTNQTNTPIMTEMISIPSGQPGLQWQGLWVRNHNTASHIDSFVATTTVLIIISAPTSLMLTPKAPGNPLNILKWPYYPSLTTLAATFPAETQFPNQKTLTMTNPVQVYSSVNIFVTKWYYYLPIFHLPVIHCPTCSFHEAFISRVM